MDKYILSFLLLLSSSGAVSAASLVNGIEWGSVLFNVSVPSQASGGVSWTFKSTPMIINGKCVGQFTGRCGLPENGSLILNNITSTDDGGYTASAFSDSGAQVLAQVFELKVYAPLTAPILGSSTNVTISSIISGSNVALQCDAKNQTVTTYSFYRDQKPVCSEYNVICSGSFLNFTPIYVNDTGSYTCTIQNPVSSNTSNSITLTVIAPVSNVTVTSNISGLVWPGIDSVSLRCSALGTNVSYSWSLQGTTISTGTRFQLSADNSMLTISPVTTSDNGNFTCTVKNVINSLSSEVKLNLASPVSAVTLTNNTSGDLWAGQDSVSLYCTAQGSAITFSWRLNGNPVPSSPPYNITNTAQNSTLTISPVSKNDIGPFTCTASNRANTITSNGINLTINWFPDGNIQCSAPAINQIVQLNCSWPGGKPAANVTLIFNGTEKTGTNEVISSVTSSGNIHGSNLICYGDQLGRTSNCTLPLEPPASKPNTTIPPVTEGSAVIMTVNLTSGTQTRAASSSQVLPAQFSWFNGTDNSSIQTSGKFIVTSTPYVSTLKIDPVSASDSGTYYCKATNIIASTTYYFKVEVTKQNVNSGNAGLNGGQIAGIVIGVLAGVAIIGIIIFFVMKKKKRSSDNERINNSMEQIEPAPYATVKKGKVNGAMAETTISEDKDDVKYAEIKFPNISSTKSTPPAKPEETVYSDVKNASLR